MKLLVSVRSVDEALLAASSGADFIDLKEPGEGALGGLPIETISSIVKALRAAKIALPISATIGDVPMTEIDRIAKRVQAVAACAVDYVKVGIERSPLAIRVLDRLSGCGHPIVPVFIADAGLKMAHVEYACSLGFPGVMVDTADKLAGSLFDVLSIDELRRFIAVVRESQAMVGLAGALRITHQPLLARLSPDFAGFRSAVCVGSRSSAIDSNKLIALSLQMHSAAHHHSIANLASPSNSDLTLPSSP
jgi:uncharacterized protein (UPF0264 family)